MTRQQFIGYALVRWGGLEPGKRPRTKLAGVTQIAADHIFAKVHKGDFDFVKTARRYDAVEIVATWPHYPTPGEVRAARRALPVYEDNNA